MANLADALTALSRHLAERTGAQAPDPRPDDEDAAPSHVTDIIAAAGQVAWSLARLMSQPGPGSREDGNDE